MLINIVLFLLFTLVGCTQHNEGAEHTKAAANYAASLKSQENAKKKGIRCG